MGMLESTVNHRGGSIIISAVLGFGLATMFRRACVGNDCIIIKGPAMDRVTGKVWKNGDECYRYRPYTVPCAEDGGGRAAQSQPPAQSPAQSPAQPPSGPTGFVSPLLGPAPLGIAP